MELWPRGEVCRFNIWLLVVAGLLATSVAVAQTYYNNSTGKTVTVVPINPPAPAPPSVATVHPHGSRSVPDADDRTVPASPSPIPQSTALDRLEVGFYGGTISPVVAARMINKIPEAGGFDFIDKNHVDPTQLRNPSVRSQFATAIAAVEFDRRRAALVEAINAAIDEQNASTKNAQPASEVDAATKAAIQESKARARLLYPDLKDANSALSKKWTEVYAQMQAAGTLPDSTDLPLIISVRAANLLHITPSSGQ